MNLFVYSGPSGEFTKYLKNIVPDETDDSEIIQFSTIGSEVSFRQHSLEVFDAANPPERSKVEKEWLVVSKDDYSTITTAGINMFVNLSEKYSFKNIVLHNPPRQLVEKIKSRYSITEPSYKYHSYGSVSKSDILCLKKEFDENILGQEQAIRKVLASLLMIPTNQSHGDRSPLVIMLYGASGSGKTEMAKILSKVIDGDGNLFREQLSMHQNTYSANYLFGGEHSDESLARDLIQRESNVILFDEFDKLNQTLYSAFYQLFDEGVFEDSNYTVNTSRAIIVCTSNFSSEDEIKRSLGEPIFSRFDACIEFRPLDSDSMAKIAARLYDRHYSELDDDQKTIVKANEDDIKTFINNIATTVKNVRILEKYIRQRISSALLDDLLSQAQQDQQSMDS